MLSTWFIDLERRVSRSEFNKACSEVGIDFSRVADNGNTYYDTRREAESAAKFGEEQDPVFKFFGICGVDIVFGGIKQSKQNTAYATQITVSSLLEKGRYEAMKRTTLDLGQKISFKGISGEWFDDVSKKPLPYSADIYQRIERR